MLGWTGFPYCGPAVSWLCNVSLPLSLFVCVSVSLMGLLMSGNHFCLTGGRAMSDRGHNQTGSKGHARPSHPNAFCVNGFQTLDIWDASFRRQKRSETCLEHGNLKEFRP